MEAFSWAAQSYTDGNVFVAFDLETTGLEPRLNEIVEIGAVKFDRNGLIARFSTLINPGIPMPAEAGKVNHIDDEMLRGKPSLDEVFPDFLLFIRDTALAAHNAPFDCAFINEKLKSRWGGKPDREADLHSGTTLGKNAWASPFPALPNPIVDTLVLSREKFPALRSYSLQNLAAELGIPAMDAHRAEDDARLCMDIFLRVLSSAYTV